MQTMRTVIFSIAFYIRKAQEQVIVEQIKLSSEDIQTINTLVTVNDFYGDKDGQESLLTVINELIQLLKDPVKHCLNANDASIFVQNIDEVKIEATLKANESTPTGTVLKQQIIANLKQLIHQSNAANQRAISPERYNSVQTDMF